MNDRLSKIAAFVQQRLETMARDYPDPDHDPVYRWQHTLRVAHYGKQIAEAEGANVEWVVVACLLHDVSHFDPLEDYRGHGRLGAQVARPLLEELGYTPEAVDNICFSVAVHVDGDAGYEHEMTIESKATSDADNVDRFGATRILQECVYKAGPPIDDIFHMTDALSARLQKLERYRQNNPLDTPAGQRLFAEQLDRQIAFFRALVGEREITKLTGDIPQG